MIRVAVVGLGYWGPNLVRNIAKLDRAKLVAVVDKDAAKLASILRQYPAAKGFASAGEMFDAGGVDAVIVATPVFAHFAIAREALERGMDVLVEKPMTATVAESEELCALAERGKRILMVDHTFVYTGHVRRIRDMIRAGEIGDVYYYDSVRVALGLFQPDINVLWDLAPHDLSIMNFVLEKKRPVKVTAVGSAPVQWKGWKRESVAYVNVHFDDGTLGSVHVNWLSPVKLRRTLIGGSKKMISYDHLDREMPLQIFDHGVDVRSDEERWKALVQYRTGDMLAPKVDQTEALETLVKTFVESIEKRSKPLTDGVAGLEVVRLLEAAQRSIEQGGAAVALPGSAS